MDLQLRDKVILVTGGAKGIGAAIVRGAAGEGAIPAIVDRDAAAAEKLRAGLASANKKCGVVCCDLSDPNACRHAVDTTLSAFGRIDALVNNAGINDRVGLEHGSPDKFVQSLERNLLHVYNMTHFALPALKASHGSIVNIASKTAVTGQGGTSGYASSKGAILALTREWALELLPDQIRVNAVVPSEVDTPLYQQWLATFPDPDEKRRAIVSRIPLGARMTKPEEIAATVLFLLSHQAAHITGQHIYVDGGYVHLDRALS
jgi:L-fucose dehydrogenase